MRAKVSLMVCCLFLALAGCSSSSTSGGGSNSGPATIVGKWVPEGDEAKELPEGSYLEFTADGKAVLNINNKGKIDTLEIGKYTVEGDKLNMTEKGLSGKEETKTSTIKSLTADQFHFVNSKGEEKKLKRFK